jgi:hypothetical protein
VKKYLVTSIIAGFGALVVSFIFGFVSKALFPNLALEYNNPSIFRPWSDPIMSLYFLYPFVLGFVLTLAWDKTKTLFTNRIFIMRGIKFALFYCLVAAIPGMLISYSSFQVSGLMILSWTLNGLLEALVAGISLAKLRP